MLHLGCWLWGTKYPGHYIDRLATSIRRNLSGPYQFHVWKPLAEDEHLTHIPGCFARLRTFDPAWQFEYGIHPGDRIVVMDLDMVVTGSLDGLFDRAEPFCILQGVNAVNPVPYNGSLWMLRAGYRPDVWSEFTVEKAEALPKFTIADDQNWLAHKLPDAGAFGPDCGVYGFQKPGWPKGDKLPSNARLVAFFGHRDPSQFTHLPWVKKHWQ